MLITSGGESQLLEYLEYYHLDRGYMLSFNFNKKNRSKGTENREKGADRGGCLSGEGGVRTAVSDVPPLLCQTISR